MLRGMLQIAAHVYEAPTLRYLDSFGHAITGSRSIAHHNVWRSRNVHLQVCSLVQSNFRQSKSCARY